MKHYIFNKKTLILWVLLIAWFSVNCTSSISNFSEKETSADSRKLKLLAAINDITKIKMPPRATNSEEINQKQLKIEKIVSQFDNAQDISTLAMLSRALSHHCRFAECEMESELEPTFNSAFWVAVKILAKNVEKNNESLERLKYMAVLDATESKDWESIVGKKSMP